MYARDQSVSDGSTLVYAVSFPYLSKDHVEIRVGDALLTSGVDYTWANSQAISLTKAAAAGIVVDRHRNTPKAYPSTIFNDGSTLTSDDLNLSETQLLYIAQEVADIFGNALQLDGTLNWNGLGRRATNFANPLSSQDLVTFNVLQSTFANTIANGIAAPVLSSVAAVRGLDHTKFTTALVTGYYSPGDGGGGVYVYFPTDTTSADNGGTILVATDGARWHLQVIGSPTVKQFGARGDGATDDYLPFAKALLACPRVVVPHTDSGYYLSAGLVVATNRDLTGELFLPGNDQRSTKLIFANNVPVCLALDGVLPSGVGGGTSSAHKLVVTRQGTPPAGAIGVQVRGQYNSILEDIFSFNHQINYSFYGHGGRTDNASANGIASTCSRVFSGGAYDVHFEIDSWPELRVTGGRAGMNGYGDAAANAHVRITSPSGGSGGAGPNTIIFDNYQFNQGGTAGPTNFLSFVNNQASAGNQAIFMFSNCHIEHITGAYIKTDANSRWIQRLSFTSVTFNDIIPMFDLSVNTEIDSLKFTGCDIAASTFNPVVNYINGLQAVGNNFSGTIATLTAPPTNNWCIAFSGNTWGSGASLTLGGTGWAEGSFYDSFSFGSNFVDNTGSPNVTYVQPKVALSSWTPVVNIGGSPTGVAGAFSGVYQRIGRLVVLNFRLSFTSKGSNTGPVTITGLPFAPAGSALDASSGMCAYVQNCPGLTGQMSVHMKDTAQMELRQAYASGTNTVTDANLASNTFIVGSLSYFA